MCWIKANTIQVQAVSTEAQVPRACFSIEGVQTDTDKVKVVLKWPIPQNIKELQSFL